ncbi:hypothetical protein L1049_007445 [Liquidambar formosana]|uniref:Transposase-associated domain-containing protein n=1 Tax=Liquidambar formosana TaxID=63359 RepID=A0AAP0N5E6_LIQFO
MIRCPCRRCANAVYRIRDEVALHLCRHGMDQTYKIWTFYGEESFNEPSDGNSDGIDNEIDEERCDDARAYEMIDSMIRSENLGSSTVDEDDDLHMHDHNEPNENASKFFHLF